jgi:glycosyltransferase involved in cell wall biosynthesis
LNEKLNICVLSEWLDGADDEGIHNFACTLAYQFQAQYQVTMLSVGSEISANRLFLSLPLRDALMRAEPAFIFYISPSCGKVAAFFRAKMLKSFASRSKVFIVALLPVQYNILEKRILQLLAPDGVFVQSQSTSQALQGLSCPVYFLPSGVDTSRFVPVDDIQKRNLREKYKVKVDAFVVLHVGHINRGRNVLALEKVTQIRNVRVILVGSTSTQQDDNLAHQLVQMGIQLIREFIPHIEEIYQLADAYIFPVVSKDAAIGVPLSVLEAMACNLPVITTRFGGLPLMFEEENGFVYFDNENELPELIDNVQKIQKSSTRQMVEPYDWKKVAPSVIEMIQVRSSSR